MQAWGCPVVYLECLDAAFRDIGFRARMIAALHQLADTARKDKIIFCRRLACNDNGADDPKKPIWKAVLRGVQGLGVIGVDVGAVIVTAGPVGAAISLALSDFLKKAHPTNTRHCSRRHTQANLTGRLIFAEN
jgi:hypothetical protein